MKSSVLAALVLLQVAAVFCEDVKYLGCYVDSGDRDLDGYMSPSTPTMTINTCIATCKAKAYKYAGLQAASFCFCGDSYGKHGDVDENECSNTCAGQASQICGGQMKNSVYSTGYMGCWRDSAVRAMKNIWFDLGSSATIDKCLEICKKAEFPYTGLQFYSHCFCSKKYQIYGEAPRVECNTRCRANQGQYCGGGWRSSVYATEVPTEF